MKSWDSEKYINCPTNKVKHTHSNAEIIVKAVSIQQRNALLAVQAAGKVCISMGFD
jgi:hypothetical protein